MIVQVPEFLTPDLAEPKAYMPDWHYLTHYQFRLVALFPYLWADDARMY